MAECKCNINKVGILKLKKPGYKATSVDSMGHMPSWV